MHWKTSLLESVNISVSQNHRLISWETSAELITKARKKIEAKFPVCHQRIRVSPSLCLKYVLLFKLCKTAASSVMLCYTSNSPVASLYLEVTIPNYFVFNGIFHRSEIPLAQKSKCVGGKLQLPTGCMCVCLCVWAAHSGWTVISFLSGFPGLKCSGKLYFPSPHLFLRRAGGTGEIH